MRQPRALKGLAAFDPDPQVRRAPVDVPAIEAAVRAILTAIGEDPSREGIRETPARVARFWKEFIDHDPGNVEKVFDHQTADQVVVVNGMRVWSLCEHHLLPFWCDVSIGYIARNRIVGLSKFARIAHAAAHRLQVQERLVEQIANRIASVSGSPDVAVLARGEHLCMSMRGVRTKGLATSSAMRGAFRRPALRAEFLGLALR